MPTVRYVELINKHNFVKVAFNKSSEIFIIYIVTLKVLAAMQIHLLQTTQIAAL